MDVYIGISGWNYPHWRGRFYPAGLPQKQEFDYACQRFNSLEINGSFYSLKRPEHYRRWYLGAPAGYRFALKGGRFITHMKRLHEVEAPLANFFASGVLLLADKLGPVLWQLPANLGFEPDRLQRFLALLPHSHAEAAQLARRHDERVAGRCHLEPLHQGVIRHAIEVRHPSFLDPKFVQLLRQHGVAAVFADCARRWPYLEDRSADFVYLRLHGADEAYRSRYSDEQLHWWAERIRTWGAGRDPAAGERLLPPRQQTCSAAYVYFDNDAAGHAPFDAQRLAALLGAQPPPPLQGLVRACGDPTSGILTRRWRLRADGWRSTGA